jgi:hypothetical protein
MSLAALYASACSAFRRSQWRRHFVKSFLKLLPASRSCGRPRFTSHTNAQSTPFTLPISVASTSMCAKRALGANSATLPATRSSKREPIAIKRSQSSTA